MIEAVSCGGLVIFRSKILLLYKNYNNRYEGWVLPKGTVEPGEIHEATALREVKEEAGVDAVIVEYIDKTMYSFVVPEDTVSKEVHWYLMRSSCYDSKPQAEAPHGNIHTTTLIDRCAVRRASIKNANISILQ